MRDRTHFRMLATLWGLKHLVQTGNRPRAERWFAVARRYTDTPAA